MPMIKHVWKIIEITMRWNRIWKALRFLQTTSEHQDCPVIIGSPSQNDQNISLTHSQILLKLYGHRSWQLLEEKVEEKAPVNDFGRKISQCREIQLQVKYVMASFCCYDKSDVIVILIITNFQLSTLTKLGHLRFV